MVTKRRVKLTNLAMRFYVKDGWTKEELDSLLIRGNLVSMDDWIDDTTEYYLLDQGSSFDIDKLKDLVEFDHMYEDNKCLTNSQIIEEFNW